MGPEAGIGAKIGDADDQDPAAAGVAADLAAYISGAPDHALPTAVVDAAKLHILDSLAAGVSGTVLPAGRHAQHFVSRHLGKPEATVWATPVQVPVSYAALANGMASHADETDDSHGPSGTHPGCSVVATALAVAEARGLSGSDVIRAVTVGYDVCGRLPLALWPDLVAHGGRRVYSTHAFGALFGAVAAAAALTRLAERQCRYALSYAVQQASGIRTYVRERQHVQKAFAYAGMPAFNATTIVDLVEAGLTGVEDPFTGAPSFFSITADGDPAALTRDLGQRFVIDETKFKKYPVGSPAQSCLDGLLSILDEEAIETEDVVEVLVGLAPNRLSVVQRQSIPSIDVEYLLWVALQDRRLTFHAAHDEARFERWLAQGHTGPIRVVPDDSLGLSHAARVELRTSGGRSFTRHVEHIPGSAENPLDAGQVEQKARELLVPLLHERRAEDLIVAVRMLDELDDVRELRRWLAVAGNG